MRRSVYLAFLLSINPSSVPSGQYSIINLLTFTFHFAPSFSPGSTFSAGAISLVICGDSLLLSSPIMPASLSNPMLYCGSLAVLTASWLGMGCGSGASLLYCQSATVPAVPEPSILIPIQFAKGGGKHGGVKARKCSSVTVGAVASCGRMMGRTIPRGGGGTKGSGALLGNVKSYFRYCAW